MAQQISQTAPVAFFARRWRCEIPLGLLFWRDMIFVGSAINLAFAFTSLLLLAMKVDVVIGMAVFFAPMPYNVFLVACVWRAADLAESAKAGFAKLASTVWLIAATVI